MRAHERDRLTVQLPMHYYECTGEYTDYGYQDLTYYHMGSIVDDLTDINVDPSPTHPEVAHILQVCNLIVTNLSVSSDAYFRVVSFDPEGPVVSGEFITTLMKAPKEDSFGFVSEHPLVTSRQGEVIGFYISSSEDVNLQVHFTLRHVPIS